jgi:HEAT repeat protein
VRAEVLHTLAEQRAPGTFDLCRRALRLRSFRDTIRAAALQALGELEDQRGITLARRHAAYGKSRWARDAAMKALASLAQAHPPAAAEIQRLLEGFLEDSSFFARVSAAQALGALGRPQAVAALRRVADSDVDRRIQLSASAALEPGAVP